MGLRLLAGATPLLSRHAMAAWVRLFAAVFRQGGKTHHIAFLFVMTTVNWYHAIR